MTTNDLPQGRVGFRFAQALVDGNYEAAQTMLSPELRDIYSPQALKQKFDQMSELFQFTREEQEQQGVPWIEVLDNRSLGNDAMDAEGWAYVSVGTEAVTVTVKPFGSEYRITELSWGRP